MQTEYGWISERGRERARGEEGEERNKEREGEERETERWSGRKRLKEKERRKQSSAPLSFAIMHGTSRRAVHLQRGCKTFRYRDIFFFFFFLPSLLYPSPFMRSKYLHIVNWSNVSTWTGRGGGATRSHNAIKPYRYTVFFYIIERHN